MKRIAFMMNTSELGGAERSLLEQASMLNNVQKDFYIPSLNASKKSPLEDHIKERYSNNRIYKFEMAEDYYKASRTSKFEYIRIIRGLISVFQALLNIETEKYHCVWLNGNKVGLPFLLYLWFKGYNGKVFYHLRDYPLKQLKVIYPLIKKLNITFIANSDSVKSRLDELFLLSNKVTIYNPTKCYANRDMKLPIKHIGVVSMLTPWKGIHQVVQMVNLFEKELREVGIEKVSVYGGTIYKTANQDAEYVKQLLDLNKSGFIKFEGLVKPEIIYKNIDLLIHPSVKEEPFGRVIVEAFASKIPVISTCLGGSAELVKDGQTGYKFFNYDYAGLFNIIKEYIRNEKLRVQIIDKAYNFSQEQNDKIEKTLNELIC